MNNFDVIFPDEREKGETTLRQCQLVMLRMLKIFDYLCQKHDIKYFLTGGTLLGAVRHNGFIPWDDDLDIGMTRDDYERFLQLAVPELPNDIFFQNQYTDKFYPPTKNVDARLRDKYSSYIFLNQDIKWHNGFMLDIFVYDKAYLPHNFFVIIQNKLLKKLNDSNKRARILKLISKYSPIPLVYSSNYLQFLGEIKQGTYIKENEFSNLIKMRFEDMNALVPQEFNSYLRRQYGDYMQLPPIEKRITSHSDKLYPFNPCNHTEVLLWEKRNLANQ